MKNMHGSQGNRKLKHTSTLCKLSILYISAYVCLVVAHNGLMSA